MTTYYKLIECSDPQYEAGEVVARCEARDRRQAKRLLRVDESNGHLYEVVPASRLYANVYDPKLMVHR